MKEARKDIGRFLVDLAKLVFGGVILSGLMKQSFEPVVTFWVGGIVVLFSATVGFIFIHKK